MKAKKIFASSLAGALAMTMAMPVGVFAAEYDSVIDPQKKGSMTIHKLIENDGKTMQSDGHSAVDATSTNSGVDGNGTMHNSEIENDGTITVTDPLDPNKQDNFSGTEDYTQTLPGYDKDADGTINVTDDTWLPLDNIGFSYLKIADIVQVNGYKVGEDVSSVGTYFTNLDTALLQLGSNLGVTAPVATKFKDDNNNYYTTAAIEKWIADINRVTATKNNAGVYSTAVENPTVNDHAAGEEVLRAYVKNGSQVFTKGDGATDKIENLDLGLYIVGETDIKAHDGLDGEGNQYVVDSYELNPEYPVVESEAAPFLVSLPTTNVSAVEGNAAGTVWEYDLDVYPKDQTNSILKRIIDPDDEGDRALRIREDYQIGDVIEQVIYADAPALQSYTPTDVLENQEENQAEEPLDEVDTYAIGADPLKKWHEKFVITDTMSKALTFNEVSKVVIIPKAVNPQYDTDLKASEVVLASGDYTVEGSTEKQSEDHTFTVTLTESGLKKLDAIQVDSQVVVYFACSLNEDAQIGTGNANVNHPTLTWKNSNTAEKSVDGNYVYDYTYELDLKKTGLEDASRAIFTVVHTDDNNQTVAKGTPETRTNKDAADVDIKFVKISDGVYRIFDAKHDAADSAVTIEVNGETYTNAVQPAKDGTLKIIGFDSDTYTFKEIATENGKNLLKSTFKVEFVEDGDPAFTYVDGEGSADKLQDGALIRATLTSENLDTNLQITGNGGIANAKIENFKSVTLRTGGEGRTMIYLTGAAVLAGLSAAVVVYKKKKTV